MGHTERILSTALCYVMFSLLQQLREHKQIKLGQRGFCVPAKSHCVYLCVCVLQKYIKKSVFVFVLVCVSYKQGACLCNILRSVCVSLHFVCVCLCLRFSWSSRITLFSEGPVCGGNICFERVIHLLLLPNNKS